MVELYITIIFVFVQRKDGGLSLVRSSACCGSLRGRASAVARFLRISLSESNLIKDNKSQQRSTTQGGEELVTAQQKSTNINTNQQSQQKSAKSVPIHERSHQKSSEIITGLDHNHQKSSIIITNHQKSALVGLVCKPLTVLPRPNSAIGT